MNAPLQALIGLHVAAGLIAVATGAATMLAIRPQAPTRAAGTPTLVPCPPPSSPA